MRKVPQELADLIPSDAHAGVASVVEELVQRLAPDWQRDSPVNRDVWIAALTIWTARLAVELRRELAR